MKRSCSVIEHLVDEHATTIFARIASRMIELSEVLRDNITKDELIPAASLVLTVAVIIAGGYVMSYLVKIEEENVQKQLGARGLKVDRKGKVVPAQAEQPQRQPAATKPIACAGTTELAAEDAILSNDDVCAPTRRRANMCTS